MRPRMRLSSSHLRTKWLTFGLAGTRAHNKTKGVGGGFALEHKGVTNLDQLIFTSFCASLYNVRACSRTVQRHVVTCASKLFD